MGFRHIFWWLPPPTTPFGNHNWCIFSAEFTLLNHLSGFAATLARGLQSSVASVKLCLQSLCDGFQWSWIYLLSRSTMEHWVEFSKLERSPCHRWIAKKVRVRFSRVKPSFSHVRCFIECSFEFFRWWVCLGFFQCGWSTRLHVFLVPRFRVERA